MSNVKSIDGSPVIGTRDVDDVLVSSLEDLLKRAKAGSLHSLYSIGFDHEGRVCKTMCDNEWNPYQVVGALEALKLEVISKREL